MTDNVKKVFDENPWFIATCDEEPNVVPVGFKRVGDDGKFYIAAVLMETTLENLKKNNKIAIAAVAGAESYQVKGTTECLTEGPMFDAFEQLCLDTFKGAFHCKYAIAVTPEKLIVASPNGDNKKELEL